jgi:hypothetical protein
LKTESFPPERRPTVFMLLLGDVEVVLEIWEGAGGLAGRERAGKEVER